MSIRYPRIHRRTGPAVSLRRFAIFRHATVTRIAHFLTSQPIMGHAQPVASTRAAVPPTVSSLQFASQLAPEPVPPAHPKGTTGVIVISTGAATIGDEIRAERAFAYCFVSINVVGSILVCVPVPPARRRCPEIFLESGFRGELDRRGNNTFC